MKKIILFFIAALTLYAHGVTNAKKHDGYINAPFLQIKEDFVVNVQDISLKNKDKLSDCILADKNKLYLVCSSKSLKTYYIELVEAVYQDNAVLIQKPYITAIEFSINFNPYKKGTK
ncbi:hypothetical protein ACHJH3_06225 [Campylobacter sp. MOP7]|uniref:hypothetical protein n=1 Tax=Campylobacter canis TaxID=3378588 RepID=UPI00387ECBCB